MAKPIIIGTHGLASKPPEALLRDHWIRCLWLNIREQAPSLADQFTDRDAFGEEAFQLVYWANKIPDHLEDDEDWCFLVERQLEAFLEKREGDEKFHVPRKGVSVLNKSKLANVAAMLSRALSIQDEIVEKQFHEINLYRNDQYIAEKVRAPLEAALRKAWADNREIILIAHSMGSFVAYDVLWELSHRTPKRTGENGRIKLFITVGSPLANATIRETLLADRYGKDTVRHYPTIVDAWHNYAAAGDVVSHDSTLGDDYHDKMQKLGLLSSAAYSGRDYVDLYSPFEEPSGNMNPHSIYGYLVQPKLGAWLGRMMKEE